MEHNCGNEKCIMCGPAPDTRTRMEAQSIKEQHEVALTNERTRLGPGERRARSASNTPEETRQRLGGKQSHSSVPPPPPPPPLPKKTVAPYQVILEPQLAIFFRLMRMLNYWHKQKVLRKQKLPRNFN